MSHRSIAQTLDSLNASPGTPTGDYFFDKLPTPKTAKGIDRDVETVAATVVLDDTKPDPRLTSPWDRGTRAMRELRWHFSESAAELGERSAHESVIYRIKSCGGGGSAALIIDPRIEEETGYRFQTARGPNQRAIWASEREGRIRAALKKLAPADYGSLAMTFSLRKPDAQVLGLLAEADKLLEPIVSHMLRTGLESVKALTSKLTLDELVGKARARLDESLVAYEVAAGITLAPDAPKPPQRQRRGKASTVGLLVPVGARGASKRRWIPVEPAA